MLCIFYNACVVYTKCPQKVWVLYLKIYTKCPFKLDFYILKYTQDVDLSCGFTSKDIH